jgi:hypothetical protein
MDAKRSARVVPVILVAVFVLVVGYLTYGNKGMFSPLAPERPQWKPAGRKKATAKSAERTSADKTKSAPKSVDWESLIPIMQAIFNRGLSPEEIKARHAVRVVEEADITGDGVPEALVTTGDAGASTDILALMRIEDGKPVRARFRNLEGKTVDLEFLQGASVMHGNSVELLSDEKAIYQGGYFMDETATRFSGCGAAAYRWHAETKTFDLDATLSKQITKTYCEREARSLLGR